MSTELHLFIPDKRFVVGLLIIVGSFFCIDLYYVDLYGGFFLWCILLLLGCLFAFLLFPVIRNPKLLISGQNLSIYSFSQVRNINFCTDLTEVIEHNGEIRSYRFVSNRKYFQISPDSYYEAEEIKRQFIDLMKSCKSPISVVTQ